MLTRTLIGTGIGINLSDRQNLLASRLFDAAHLPPFCRGSFGFSD